MIYAYVIIAVVIALGVVSYYTMNGGVQTIYDGGLLFITGLTLGVLWLPAMALGLLFFAFGFLIKSASESIHGR